MQDSNPLINALINIAWQLPLMVVWGVGFIFAVVRWSRHPRKSLLLVIALALFFVSAFLFPLAFHLIRDQLITSDVSFEAIDLAAKAVGITHMIFNMGAWILLMLAAFWPSPDSEHKTVGQSNDTKPSGHLTPQQAESLGSIKPLSKPFFISMIAGTFGLVLVLTLVSSIFLYVADEPVIGSVLACFNLIPLLIGMVVLFVFLHRIWSAIQGGPARTTPGKAVGFLFIPFFNFYWLFQVYWGWAKDYNRLIKDCQLDVPVMPEGLALTLSVFGVVSTPLGLIPFVGPFVGIVNVVLLILFMVNACTAVEALAKAKVRIDAPAVIS